jgi:DNA polymerase-3 subunit delta'
MTVLPWFNYTVDALQRVIGEDRLPHGLLVVVPDGWGRDHFLGEMVRLMLGMPSALPPLDCFAHPDFMWVRSYDKDGEPNKVTQVDAIRELGEFAVQRVVSSPRKVAVMPQAHNTTLSAANALLRTLEEPVSNCCLVLETNRPGQLLPTIVSRCQKLPFRLRRDDALRWLEQGLSGTSTAPPKSEATGDGAGVLSDALAICGGGPLHALELLTRRDAGFQVILQALGAGQSRAGILDQLAATADLPSLLDQWYRIAVRALAGNKGFSAERLIVFADELVICRDQIDGIKGVNARLLLDRLLCLWEACVDS